MSGTYLRGKFINHKLVGDLHSLVHHFIEAALFESVSGYVCNHGSPSGERDTASPRGRYGERPQRDSV